MERDHVPFVTMRYLKFTQDPTLDKFVSEQFKDSYEQRLSFKTALEHKSKLAKGIEFNMFQTMKRFNKNQRGRSQLETIVPTQQGPWRGQKMVNRNFFQSQYKTMEPPKISQFNKVQYCKDHSSFSGRDAAQTKTIIPPGTDELLDEKLLQLNEPPEFIQTKSMVLTPKNTSKESQRGSKINADLSVLSIKTDRKPIKF